MRETGVTPVNRKKREILSCITLAFMCLCIMSGCNRATAPDSVPNEPRVLAIEEDAIPLTEELPQQELSETATEQEDAEAASVPEESAEAAVESEPEGAAAEEEAQADNHSGQTEEPGEDASAAIEEDEKGVKEDPAIPAADEIHPKDILTLAEAPIAVEQRPAETTFATVEELCAIDMPLEAGQILVTLGYYSENDGGGAEYLLSAEGSADGATSFLLANGMTATMVIGDEVSVKQYGAIGDGSTDDCAPIQAALDSAASTVTFPSGGAFMVQGDLFLLQSNKEIRGNGSTLYTDDGFSGAREFFLTVRDVENISIDSLNFTALQTKNLSFKTQLGVARVSNLSITNSVFTGPEASYTSSGAPEINHFINIDLYTAWNNVTVDGCRMYINHDGEEGICFMARDLQGKVSGGLVFTNNVCEKVSHDEVFVIGGRSATVQGARVSNNTFVMRDGQASSSNIAVTIGSNSTVNVSDVVFENNTVDVECAVAVFYTNAPGSGIRILNNNITFTRAGGRNGVGSQSSGGFVFYQDTNKSGVPVLEVKGNQILINNEGAYKANSLFRAKTVAEANVINVLGDLPSAVFCYAETAVNNEVLVTGDMKYLSYNTPVVEDNTVLVAGAVDTIFRYHSLALAEEASLSENKVAIQSSAGKSVLLLAATDIKMNDQNITLSKNQIAAPKSTAKDFLYNVKPTDSSGKVVFTPDNAITNNFAYTSSTTVDIVRPKAFDAPAALEALSVTSIDDGQVPLVLPASQPEVPVRYVVVLVLAAGLVGIAAGYFLTRKKAGKAGK